EELLADVSLDRRTMIVFAAGLSRRTGSLACPDGQGTGKAACATTDDGPAWKGLAHCPYVPALLQLAQTLHQREGVPRLFVVTNGAAGMAGDPHLDLGQA